MTTAARLTTRAADLGPAPDELQDQALIWRTWGDKRQWDNPSANYPPAVGPAYATVSVAIYDQADATGTKNVWASATAASVGGSAPIDEPGRFEVPTFPRVTIPYRSGWTGAPNTTDRMMVVEMTDGTWWELQGVRPMSWWDRFLLSIRQIGKAEQPRENEWVFDKGAYATPANVFTYTGSGCGDIPFRAMVVTPDEVAAARANGHRGVGHLLPLVSAYSETGPFATFLPPATRVEMPTAQNGMLSTHPNAPHPRLTKQGLVLASSLTEDEIDTRLAALHPTDLAWRATVKVWWMTVAEHGFLVGRTTGRGTTTIECSTMAAGYPDASAWAQLGHTSEARNRSVFTGFPWDTLYVVLPSADGVAAAPVPDPPTPSTPASSTRGSGAAGSALLTEAWPGPSSSSEPGPAALEAWPDGFGQDRRPPAGDFPSPPL